MKSDLTEDRDDGRREEISGDFELGIAYFSMGALAEEDEAGWDHGAVLEDADDLAEERDS